jgi:hypothetical protein
VRYGYAAGMDKPEQVVRRLRKVAGTTYPAEAGIRTNDKPMPPFQLLVLCMLASKPIDATTAMRAARYDESSATRLVEMAERIAVAEKLKQFKGIGDIGADIFLREVQDVWTWVRPHFDYRATAAAKRLGLPAQPAKLGDPAARFNARLAG